MRATWYVLEDGRVVDPNECVGDDKGELHHKDGVPVAKRGDAYSSRGVDLDVMRAKEPIKTIDGGLGEMTVAQLRDLAAERKIDLGDAAKKADIIAAIEAGKTSIPGAKDREIKAGEGTKTYETR